MINTCGALFTLMLIFTVISVCGARSGSFLKWFSAFVYALIAGVVAILLEEGVGALGKRVYLLCALGSAGCFYAVSVELLRDWLRNRQRIINDEASHGKEDEHVPAVRK